MTWWYERDRDKEGGRCEVGEVKDGFSNNDFC